jgi:hypothetical protein
MTEQLPTPRGARPLTRRRRAAGFLARAAVRTAAAIDRNDVFGVAGAGLVTAGLWEIYPPAALIVLGVLLLALAVAGAKNAGRP